jgi:transposase
MSKPAIEVITSVERRRRWSATQKERLVAASVEPGATVSAVAREAGIHPGQLYGWRRQLLRGSQPAASFAAVQICGRACAGCVARCWRDRGGVRERVADADQRSGGPSYAGCDSCRTGK